MKILTINWCYKIYSTGKIIKDIENVLAPQGCTFIHCYESGELSTDENAYRLSGHLEYYFYYVFTRLIGMQYGGGVLSNIRLLNIIKKEKPDIVHIHCPNAYSINLYQLLDFLKKKSINTIITNHAEYFFTGNCAHAFACEGYMTGCKSCDNYKDASHSYLFNRTSAAWKKMKKAFEDFQKIRMVAVSPWAERRIKTSTICKGLPGCTIYNGIDTKGIFHPKECSNLQGYRDTKEQKIILCVTSSFSDDINSAKGGIYLIRLAENLQEMNFNGKILVAGPCIVNGDYSYLHNFNLLGHIDDQNKLAQLYSLADLTIVTSKRETFGLSCAESMCCGTPVVGFKNGGTETIALQEYSAFTEYGDVEGLQKLVMEWKDKKESISQELAEKAQKVYSKETMALKYFELYNEMLLPESKG